MFHIIRKQYFILVNMGIIAVIIYLCVNMFYRITKSENDIQVPAGNSEPEKTTSKKQTYKPISFYSEISKRDLFKTKESAVSTVITTPSDEIEVTDLKLKLWGTSVGQGEKDYAVIEDSNNRSQNLYRAGDKIQDAIVKLIQRETVILSVNGQEQKLEMEKAGKGGARDIEPVKPLKRIAKSTRKTRTQKVTLKRSMVEESLTDISKLNTQANVRQHFNRGKPDGLMLSRIKPKSIFRKMGLRNGDVITGISGEKIEAVGDVNKLYENLKKSENLSLQIKRRGRSKTIEYTIK